MRKHELHDQKLPETINARHEQILDELGGDWEARWRAIPRLLVWERAETLIAVTFIPDLVIIKVMGLPPSSGILCFMLRVLAIVGITLKHAKIRRKSPPDDGCSSSGEREDQ